MYVYQYTKRETTRIKKSFRSSMLVQQHFLKMYEYKQKVWLKIYITTSFESSLSFEELYYRMLVYIFYSMSFQKVFFFIFKTFYPTLLHPTETTGVAYNKALIIRQHNYHNLLSFLLHIAILCYFIAALLLTGLHYIASLDVFIVYCVNIF